MPVGNKRSYILMYIYINTSTNDAFWKRQCGYLDEDQGDTSNKITKAQTRQYEIKLKLELKLTHFHFSYKQF